MSIFSMIIGYFFSFDSIWDKFYDWYNVLMKTKKEQDKERIRTKFENDEVLAFT